MIYIKFNIFFCLNVIDIDECSSLSNPCMENSVCSNTKGSYVCTCKPGYLDIGHSCKGNIFVTNLYSLTDNLIKYFEGKKTHCLVAFLYTINWVPSYSKNKQVGEKRPVYVRRNMVCFYNIDMVVCDSF